MSKTSSHKRPTVRDLARAAGVSLATIDRVLNRRPGVRPATIERVEQAIAEIGFERDLSASLLARGRALQITVLLPAGENEFFQALNMALGRQVRAVGGQRLTVQTRRVPALDGPALGAALDGLTPEQTDCAVVVAVAHPAVAEAIGAARTRGVPVITLVSDLPGAARAGFVGIDNFAAGRTAAALLGRFCPQGAKIGGRIGLIAGSLSLRDHRERVEGFAAVMREDFPHLGLAGPIEGHDRPEETEKVARALIADMPDLCGLYALGAGNRGLVAALAASGRAEKIRVVAHELTATGRQALTKGLFDVILDQNPEGEIAAALAAARQVALDHTAKLALPPIELRLYLRDTMG